MGLDVVNFIMMVVEDGDSYVFNGEKIWIFNGGIVDVYMLFVCSGEVLGVKGLFVFVVIFDLCGFEVVECFDMIVLYLFVILCFINCCVKKLDLIGKLGEGFKIVMFVLDIFCLIVVVVVLGFVCWVFDEVFVCVMICWI